MTTNASEAIVANASEAIAALNETIELLTPPGAWIQFASARDADGYSVSPLSERACKFCLTGALLRATERVGDPDAVYARAHKAMRIARRRRKPASAYGIYNDLPAYNDAADDVDDVLALARDAIAMLEAAPAGAGKMPASEYHAIVANAERWRKM